MQNQTRTHIIAPTNIYSEADRRCEELKKIAKETERSLTKAPDGKIRIVKEKDHAKFYLRTDPSERSGTYISKSDAEKIGVYTQKSYNQKLVKLLKKEINALEDYLMKTGGQQIAIRQLYSDNPGEVKKFIRPVDMSDEDYIAMWAAEKYDGKEIPEEMPVYETVQKERVRSKSELTIANALAGHGVPYKYECPLVLKNGTRIHPDFTVLNVKERRQLYWEHRGMMDNEDYARHTVDRIKQYMKSGIVIGRDLIITEETSSSPLGTDEIESIIRTFFL